MSHTNVPAYASGFVRAAFNRAIDGAGKLPGAARSADRRLAQVAGDTEEAIDLLIGSHVTYAGSQGFVTNLGGIASMAVLAPTNVAALALVQCHLVAGIAHLRGLDVADPRTRDAVLACMIGPSGVKGLIGRKSLPGGPRELAHADEYDSSLTATIATALTAELISRTLGKRTVGIIARRVPVVGGGVGAASDVYSTRKIGKYAAREFR